MIALRVNSVVPNYNPMLANFAAECEIIRAWLVNNAQGKTGVVRPALHMQAGTVRKVEIESHEAIYKKSD